MTPTKNDGENSNRLEQVDCLDSGRNEGSGAAARRETEEVEPKNGGYAGG